MSRSRKSKPSTKLTFFDLLIPNTILVCEDYIVSNKNTISYLKTIEILRADVLPFTPDRLMLIASFLRNPSADTNTFSSLKPEFKVQLINPSEAVFDIGTFDVSVLDPLKPWNVERLIVEFAKGDIQFNSSGGYTFQILGRIEDQEFSVLQTILLPIARKLNRKRAATK